jgi:hypothetical protein
VKGEPRPVTTTVTVHFFLDSMPRIPAGSAAITGRIVHADGTPAAGVRVDVVLAPVGSSPPKFTESSGAYELRIAAAPLVRLGFPTDSSGDYRIDGIGPGTYKVIATVGDTGIYYPGASHDKAVSLTIESNETILVGIDFTVP